MSAGCCPIFIGGAEATAIAFALEGVMTPRPMTHDLMKNLLDELACHGRAHRASPNSRDGTFFAEIQLTGDGVSTACQPSVRRHRPGRPHGHADLRRGGGPRAEAGFAVERRGRGGPWRSSSSGSSSTGEPGGFRFADRPCDVRTDAAGRGFLGPARSTNRPRTARWRSEHPPVHARRTLQLHGTRRLGSFTPNRRCSMARRPPLTVSRRNDVG